MTVRCRAPSYNLAFPRIRVYAAAAHKRTRRMAQNLWDLTESMKIYAEEIGNDD